MTRIIIEVQPNDEAREYAASTRGVEAHDDKIVIDGMAQHIREVINFMVTIGMIEKPKPKRRVFYIHDPDGRLRAKTSDDQVYPYAVVSRTDTDALIQEAVDFFSGEKVMRDEWERRGEFLKNKAGWMRQIGHELLDGYKDFNDFRKKYSAEMIKKRTREIMGMRGYHVKFCTDLDHAHEVKKKIPSQVRVFVETLKTKIKI